MELSNPYRDNTLFYLTAKKVIIGSGILLAIISTAGPNPGLIIPSWIVLFLLFKWFAVDDFPPVILIGLLYQWFQVSVKAIFGTVTFTSFDKLSEFPGQLTEAYLLSCLALLVFGFGIYITVKKIRFVRSDLFKIVEFYSIKNLFILYLIFFLISGIFYGLRHTVPGIFQFIVAIVYLKWSILFLLFYTSYQKNEGKFFLWIIVIFEFLSGFISYFASFKDIIFIVLICLLSIIPLTQIRILKYSILGIALLAIGLFWTAIKPDYREFLNQGTQKQVIKVDNMEAVSFLTTKIDDVDEEVLYDASEDLLNRISYIDYFSSAIAYVPKETPHANGNVLLNAINHVLVPRIFNPNKPIIDESKHLTKYTGIFYSTISMGVSFSLGYVGDFYVDFGPIVMFLPLFLIGLLVGFIHNFIFNTSRNYLWALAMIVPIFFLIYKFEISLIKLFGNLLVYCISFYLLNKFIIPKIDFLLKK